MQIIAVNRRATFDYAILEEYEAGIVLFGFEVKAVKSGRINLAGAYVVFKDGAPMLLNATIPPYQEANTPKEYDPERSRALLLNTSEIKELSGKTAQKGLTILPLRVYIVCNRVKLAIGLARHKRTTDKRETIRKREDERAMRRAVNDRNAL